MSSIKKAMKKKRHGNEPSHDITKLPVQTLMNMPVEILAGLPPDKLVSLPDQVQKRLPASAFKKFPPELLDQLSVGTLSQLATELGQLHPSVLSRLPASRLAEVLKYDPRLHQLLTGQVLAKLRYTPTELFKSLDPAIQKSVDEIYSDYNVPLDGSQTFLDEDAPTTAGSHSATLEDLPPAPGPIPRNAEPGSLVREETHLRAWVTQLEDEKRKFTERMHTAFENAGWDGFDPNTPLSQQVLQFALHYQSIAEDNGKAADSWVKKADFWKKLSDEATNDRNVLEKKVQDLSGRLEETERTLNDVTTAYQRLESENKQRQQDVHALQKSNQAALKREKEQHEAALQHLIDEHTTEMSELMTSYEKELAEARAAHSKDLALRERRYRVEVDRLLDRIVELEPELEPKLESDGPKKDAAASREKDPGSNDDPLCD